MRLRGKPCSVWILGAVALLELVGCAKPRPPQVVGGRDNEYRLLDFKTDYDAYRALVDAGRFNDATVWRDRMIGRIRVDIEAAYRDFEESLFSGRAGANVGADLVELFVAGTTAVVGGETVKAALAAALTVFKGARLSIDQNLFRERTTEAIISKMRAARDRKTAAILAKMTDLPVPKYGFEEAWTDLVELYYDGSLHSAMIELAADSAKSAAEANAALQKVEELRSPILAASTDEITTMKAMRAKAAQLRAQNDIAGATAILSALGVTVGAGENAFDKLDDALAELPFDRARFPEAVKAFGP